MPDLERMKLKTLTAAIELLERHPRAVRLMLKPLANAPLISGLLPVLPRAYMGATAFEIHDVDLKKGRIGIGGVEEIMAGSKIIHLLHTTLGERMSEEEKKQALYELGVSLCTWEVTQALSHGRWAPAMLTPLIVRSSILDEVQTDPLLARFFEKTLNMMSRLITDEGGWGHLRFDLSTQPIKVVLENSQEAQWLSPSHEPVCHFYTGIVAGYASTIAQEPFACREISCKAQGNPHCVFELYRARKKP